MFVGLREIRVRVNEVEELVQVGEGPGGMHEQEMKYDGGVFLRDFGGEMGKLRGELRVSFLFF